MPSNARNTKTVPPIIAAAKACIADLQQLHRAAGADLIAADFRRGAGRQPAPAGKRKSAPTARKL